MTNPLGKSTGHASKAPIGVEGVQAYVEEMNRKHPHSPYIWRVGERMHEGEGRIVKCVEVIRKSELRNAGPRIGGRAAQKLIADTTKAFEDA